MAFVLTAWTLASYVVIALASWLLAWTAYYDFTRTHIPPGMKERVKLRASNLLLNSVFGVVSFACFHSIVSFKIWRARYWFVYTACDVLGQWESMCISCALMMRCRACTKCTAALRKPHFPESLCLGYFPGSVQSTRKRERRLPGGTPGRND